MAGQSIEIAMREAWLREVKEPETACKLESLSDNMSPMGQDQAGGKSQDGGDMKTAIPAR